MRTDFLSKSCQSIALFLRACSGSDGTTSGPELHELEQRVFYDASPLGVLLDDISGDADYVEDVDLTVDGQLESSIQEDFSFAPDETQLDLSVNEVVFIDRNVENYRVLIEDLANQDDVAVYVLDSNVDGVQQISDALENHTQLSAVHIVSHGDRGFFQAGSSTVSMDNLHLFNSQFASWGNSLAADADLLIYGCNVAGSDEGQALVETLEALTGADVAASEDLTGADSLGGNWELEFQSGLVESKVVFSESATLAWMSTLDVTGYPTSNGDDNSFEHISNVAFAGINNNSVADVGAYADYSSQNATIIVGQSNTLSVTISPDGNNYITAWIDWNQDKDFDDAGEEYVVATTTGVAGPHTLNIITPDDALAGTTIMRVTLTFATVPVSSGAGFDGEVEDYSVTVVDPFGSPTVNENSANGLSVVQPTFPTITVADVLGRDSSLSYDATTNKFYRVETSLAAWNVAQASADGYLVNGVGGQLVNVRSAYEDGVVQGLINPFGTEFYLGGTDATVDGQWNWYDDGAEADRFWNGGVGGSAPVGAYSAFSGEPGGGIAENYLAKRASDGAWLDTSGSGGRGSVMEWDAAEVLAAHNYTLADSAGGRFAIDNASGEITVLDGGQLDFESNATHDVIVQANGVDGVAYLRTVTININDVVEATQTLPFGQSVNEDGLLTFSAAGLNPVTVSDTFAGSGTELQVRLSVSNGVLTLPQVTGLTFVEGANGTSSFVFNGTETDINAALEGMTFTPSTNYYGAVTLDMSTSASVDLAGHYSFDVGTSDVSAGTQYNGSLGGNAFIDTDGDRGQVLRLDGVGDYVDIATNFTPLTDVSTAAWVKFSSVSAAGGDVINIGNSVVLRVDVPGLGTGASFYDGTTNYSLDSGIFLADDQWHHVAYTIDDSTNRQVLYIDGVVVAEGNINATIVTPQTNTRIGGHVSGVIPSRDFNGLIDDARVYKRALSIEEIASLATDQAAVSGSLSITVNPVNDATQVLNLDSDFNAIANDGVAVNLDVGTAASLLDFDSTFDLDGGTLQLTGNGFDALDQLGIDLSGTVSLSAGLVNGSEVQVSGVGIGTLSTVTNAGFTVTFNSFSSLSNVETLVQSLDYQSTSTNYGSRSVDLVLVDGDGTANGGTDTDSVTIYVDVFSSTGGGISTPEDTTYVFSSSDFAFTGVTGSEFQSITVSSLPTGSLKLNNVDVVIGQQIDKADIDANLLTYDPIPNANGSSLTGFNFYVNDGSQQITVLAGSISSFTVGAASLAPTNSIIENPSNFGPAGTNTTDLLIGPASSTIDSTYLAQGTVFFDGYTLDGDWTAGELSDLDAWVTAGGILISTNDDTSYDPVATHFGLTIGGTANAIWNVADSTNPIINGDFGLVGNVGSTFSASGSISYFDSGSLDVGDLIVATDSVSGQPTVVLRQHGDGWILFMSDEGPFRAGMTGDGSVSTPNDILVANIFSWAAGVASPNEYLLDVSVSAINDTPVVSGPGLSYAVDEQTSLSIEGTGFTVSDVDVGSGTMTATLVVGEGEVTVSAGDSGVTIASGNGSSSVVLTGTLDQIDDLLTGSGTGTITYFNSSDTPSASTTFTVTVNDGGNTGADPGTTADGSSEEGSAMQTIAIASINDAPVISGNELISNGEFQSDLSGWNTVGTVTYASALRFGEFDAVAPHSASQSFTTVIGQTYMLRFDYRDDSSVKTQELQVTVNGSGSNLTENLVTSGPGFSSVSYAFSFVADSTTSHLTFLDTSPDSASVDGFVDNVSVEELPSFTSITEDEIGNSGDSVATIVGSVAGDLITDSDGDPEGIAVIRQTSTFEYSIDGGFSWQTISSPSESNALLLRSSDLIRFIPNGTGSQSESIEFRAWDQSSGTEGTYVDASIHGGEYAFSNETEVASIVTTAVNDTPVVSGPGSSFSVDEQTSLSIEGTGFSLSDVDAASGTMTATLDVGEGGITVIPGNSGVTIVSGNGLSSVVLTGTVSQIDSLLTGAGTGTITYYNGSDSPSASTTFTVTVNDGGNTGADPGTTGDGSSEEGFASQTIGITAYNDDPTNAGLLPNDISATEDVLSNVDLSAVDFDDVDAGSSSLTVTLSTSSGGQLTVAAGTGITLGGTATARTFTGSLVNLNNYFNTASNVQYLHNVQHNNGDNADSITVVINDNGNTGLGGGANQSLGVVNVDITAINDAPTVNVPVGFNATEQTTLVISDGSMSIADVDSSNSIVSATVSVVEGVVAGAQGDSGVTISNSGTATLTLTGTVVQINNLLAGTTTGNVTYFNGSDTPSSSVQLTLTVNDGGNTGLDPGDTGDSSSEEGVGITTISVAAVNDEPVPTSYVSNAGVEDVSSVYVPASGTDVDGSVDHIVLVSLTSNGTLYLDAGLTMLATTGVNLVATGNTLPLYYVPDADWNGSDQYTFRASDDLGLVSSALGTVDINVAAVNDEEVLAVNSGDTVDEGSSGNALSTTMLSTTDVDNLDAELIYTVGLGPGNGTLRNNGSALGIGGTFSQADLLAGLITYDHDGSETISDAFNFTVDDGAGTSTAGTFNWTIDPINDLPVITSGPGGGTYNENAAGTFFNNGLTIADADNTDFDSGVLTVDITGSGEASDRLTLLDDANVTLVGTSVRYDFGGGAVEVGQLSGGIGDSDPLLIAFNSNADITAVQAVAQRVVFNSASDDPSTAQRTIAMSLSDGDGGDSNTVTRVMNVVAHNDDPFNAGSTFNGTTINVFEDVQSDLNLSFLNIQDYDDRGLGMTLTLSTSGAGNLYASNGPGVGVSGNGTSTLVLTGSTADIDAFLNVSTNIEYLHTSTDANGIAADTLTLVLNDGGNFGLGGGADVSLGMATIDILAINDAPTLDLDGDDSSGGAGPNYITSFTENLGPVLIADIDAVLGDVDSPNLASISVTIMNQIDGAAEVLAANTMGTSISANYNSGTGVLTLNGSESRANYEQVLKTITYNNTSENPDTTIRTLRTIANDGVANSNPAISLFLINAVNDEQVLATNDGATVAEGSLANIITTAMLQTTDVDNSNAEVVYTLDSLPGFGTLYRNGSPLSIASTFTQADVDLGLITYDHDGSQVSNDSFSFTVDDGSGSTTAGVFDWVITNVNDEESLDVNDPLVLAEGSTGIITNTLLLTSDVDHSAGQIVYTLDSNPLYGELFRAASRLGLNDTFTQSDIDTGLITYVHDGSETASDDFDFTVDDGEGTATSDTFVLSVTPVNDAPTTDDLIVVGLEDATSIAINLTGADVDGIVQSFALDSLPANGILYLDAGLTTPVLAGTDMAATGNALTLYFVPDTNWNGTASFQYGSKDDLGLVDPSAGNVTVNVSPVNDAPVGTLIESTALLYNENAGPQIVTQTILLVDVDDTFLESAEVRISDNYVNGQDVLDFVDFGAIASSWDASTGILTLSGTDSLANYQAALRSVTYENVSEDPSSLVREIQFTVHDGDHDSNALTRDVSVLPINDAPVAQDEGFVLDENDTLTTIVSVLDNDIDVDNLSLNASVLIAPAHGSVTMNSDGTFVYVHDGSESVSDSFVYQVADGDGGFDSAIVNLTINPVNDVPQAVSDAYSVGEGQTLSTSPADGVLGNDFDAEGDLLVATVIGGPSNGSVLLNSDGSFTYTHDGSETTTDQFIYQANDGNGGIHSAVVMLTIQPINDIPVGIGESYSMFEDSVLVGDVSANDYDDDGDTLGFSLVNGPQNANAFSLNSDGTFSYEPASDYFGTDSFVYQVSDGNGGLDTVTVNISVTNINDAPVAIQDTFAVLSGEILNATDGVLENDYDVDNDPLTALLLVAPSNGTIIFGADGTFQYVPDQLFIGTDTFTYVSYDGTTNGVAVEVQILVETGLLETGEGEGDGSGDGENDQDSDDDNSSLSVLDPAKDDKKSKIESQKSLSLKVNAVEGTEFLTNEVAKFKIVQLEEISDRSLTSRSSFQFVDYSSSSRSSDYQLETNRYQSESYSVAYDALMLWEQMDDFAEEVLSTSSDFDVNFTLSSITGMATLGGVLWLLRGGVLMATTLSQLPTWRMIDPLTVLDSISSKSEIGEDELGNFFKK